MSRDPVQDPGTVPTLGASGDGAGEAPLHVADQASLVDAQTSERLWWAAGAVWRSRWWIMIVTALVAGAAVYLSLQIPNRYRAETRVLLPETGGGGMLAGALSSLPASAAALLGGGGGGGFTRYLAILTSPSTLGTIVDQFDLVDVYELQEEAFPREAAIGRLYERSSFDVNIEFDFLGVSVLDEDPARAAQMANAFVEHLNERHIAFQTSSAAENRAFLQTRLEQANTELDAAQGELQALQERSGIVEPGAQAEALFSSLGTAQAEVAAAEIAYQTLLSQYGAENPDVQAARAGLDAARGQAARLRAGSEAGLPSLQGLPRVQREYASAMQELTIQRAIIETIQPLYEQAALQEQREADAVQILDPAAPPTRKAEPRRSVIVIAATLSAFLVALAVVLALALWRAGAPTVLARLRAEAAAQ